MKLLAIFVSLLVCVSAFAQDSYVGRRTATVVSNATFEVSSFDQGTLMPVLAYCAFVPACTGTVTFGATVAGQTQDLGTVAVTNSVVVRLPMVWLRAAGGDALMVTKSGTNLLVSVDFSR